MSDVKTDEQLQKEYEEKMIAEMAEYAMHKDAEQYDDDESNNKTIDEYKADLESALEKLNSNDESGDEEATINPDDYTEDELEALMIMGDYSNFHMKTEYEYVVRGALLYCDCGSHHRRLNLPKCHGVYRLGNPFMRSDDCKAGVEGTNINITSFGICKAPGSGSIGMGNISLAPEVRGEDGLPIVGKTDGAVITGNRCMASFPSGTWENTHYETQISDEGKFAITTNSFLKCRYGGIIRVVTSGQEITIQEEDVAEPTIETKFTEMMQNSYGMTADESVLIEKAYNLLSQEADEKGLLGQEKIHHIFSNMSSLCTNYNGDAIRWSASGDIPKTDDTLKHLERLGMDKSEVLMLYTSINQQHRNPTDKDFAHELVQYAIFSDDSIPHSFLDGFIGNMDALGSYKGDVYSTRMGIDDMNSDVDANNIYNRMINSDKEPIDVMYEYNQDVLNSEINRVDEFLSFYGNGDTEVGLEYIKQDLATVDMGAHYIASGLKGFVFENIQDAMIISAASNSVSVSTETFYYMMDQRNIHTILQDNQDEVDEMREAGEEVKSILETKDEFLVYLEDRMSR